MRLGLCLFLLFPICVWAQNGSAAETAYYFDISRGNSLAIHDVKEGSLNIQYQDLYGRSKDIPLLIYNAKNEMVGNFTLSKTYGLNHFRINIGQLFSSWPEDEIYACRTRDEMGNKYELLIRKRTSVTEEPEVNIFVNPLSVSCNDFEGNVVDFYGTITGGKAPYTVNWYVLNDAKSEFLYQPREEVITRPGRTMVINVDKNPDYYVMVLVTDACNKETKQMVHLTCQDEKNKVNTLFVEPLKSLPAQRIKSTN
ncbi:MAG TPA: hypothetical protein VGK59_03505 [Ohtaekwangia sp.]